MTATVPLGRPISVRLPESMRARIAEIATATRRSQGDVVREILERDLPRLEWEQRILQRAADARAGRAETVSLEEMQRDLGIHGQLAPVDILDDIK